jgi:hypothetical protein
MIRGVDRSQSKFLLDLYLKSNLTHLSSKIDAVHNQNQILPVNEENENQIPKPKQQHHGDLLQELHTEPQKNNLGQTSAAMR